MGRRKTQAAAIPVGWDPTTAVHTTPLSRVIVGKALPLTPPWLGVAGTALAGGCTHLIWGTGGADCLAWATCGLTTTTVGLAWLTWTVAHGRRGVIGRWHSTLTTLAAGSWITAATITGPLGTTGSVLLLGGSALAVAWNIRRAIRGADPDATTANSDGLRVLFDRAKDAAGLTGSSVRTTHTDDHRVTGVINLPAGQVTPDDAARRTLNLEGAAGLPPGSVSIVGSPDRADQAHITVSDPRVMRNPIPYPGPSRPGASIADPLRIGLWQDLIPAEYRIVGHHLQIMGMSGSGKSVGACWNLLGETITRRDVAVLGVDISKGDQTMGPLAPALHRLAKTPEHAVALIEAVHKMVRPRTDYLAKRGLQRWAPGCGLAYWILWLEEAPDVVEHLDGDRLLSLVRTCRSAGIGLVFSLQRSDWTQMPTFVRGQLAKMCFGVADSGDADFGLSERQTKRGADPAQWGTTQPGMAYLDAPGVDDARLAMPMRTYSWFPQNGTDAERQRAAAQAMTAHAAAHPATGRLHVTDPFLAALPTLGTPTPNPTTGQASAPIPETAMTDERRIGPLGDPTNTPDPDPSLTADIDDEITTPETEWTFTPMPEPDPPVTAEDARRALRDQIIQWAAQGKASFATRDVRPLLDRIGRARSWAQGQYKSLKAEGLIGDYDENSGTYPIRVAPGV